MMQTEDQYSIPQASGKGLSLPLACSRRECERENDKTADCR